MRLISGRNIAAKLCRLAAIPMVFCSINANAQSLPAGTWAGSPGAKWDALSWGIFIDAVAPAAGGTSVKFETWASDVTTYQTKDPTWPSDTKLSGLQRFQFSGLAKGRLPAHGTVNANAAQIPGDGCQTPQPAAAASANFPANGCIAEEVRRNRPAFDYIVKNKLYTTAGLAENFKSKKPIEFPKSSVEVKADWVKFSDLITWLGNNGVTISDDDIRKNYYVTTDDKTDYALVALHLNSKLTPNWVWLTIEHEKNPGRCDTMGCFDDFGAAVPKVPADLATANTQYGACSKSPALTALFKAAKLDDIWNHYCLKETQIDFVQASSGDPIISGNSVIERINADGPIAKSSCISCHAAASFDSTGALNFADLGASPVGKYILPSAYKSYDFVWGPIQIKTPKSN